MTTATITFGKDKQTICAQGHAEGSTEVCAAITGLLYSLGGYLKNTCPQGITKWRMESGDVVLECKKTGGVDAAFTMAAIGLMQLEKQYPQYIRVKVED